jgi:glutamate-1-semialdehyde 2,1-aminomutase
MKSGPKSRAMIERAQKAIPRGVSSNFRYWGDDKTLVLDRGEGGYIYDLDGKRYIDYRLGFGPVIFGHGREEITDRVKKYLSKGNCFAMTHELEIIVAEKIKKLTGVDMVRYANSGSEATMAALRIARSYTGRDNFLKFEGAYHGFHDAVMWNTYPPIPPSGYRNYPIHVPQGTGIPRGMADYVYLCPFNDLEMLERRVAENWQNMAAIIIEPLLGNQASIMPQNNFLQKVRALCDKYGIVMILDEVKTGFRVAPGGAQELFNVKADIVTYAKCLGSGFPTAAIAGKFDIMNEIAPGKIPHGGTYAANVVAMAAADAVLDLIEAGELKKVDAHGKKLMAGWRKILDKKGISAVIQGPAAMPGMVFTKKEVCTQYRDWAESDHGTYEAIIESMIDKGVMPDPDSREPWFISSMHTDADADMALDVFEKAITEVVG